MFTVNVGKYTIYMDAMGLLMVQKSCNHQLMLVVHPIIYDVFFYIPGGDGRFMNHQLYQWLTLAACYEALEVDGFFCLVWFCYGFVMLFFGTILIWKWWIVVFIEDCNWIGKMDNWKNHIEVLTGDGLLCKQVKFRTTSKKSKDIALCTLLPPQNRQPTGNSLWPFWDW